MGTVSAETYGDGPIAVTNRCCYQFGWGLVEKKHGNYISKQILQIVSHNTVTCAPNMHTSASIEQSMMLCSVLLLCLNHEGISERPILHQKRWTFNCCFVVGLPSQFGLDEISSEY